MYRICSVPALYEIQLEKFVQFFIMWLVEGSDLLRQVWMYPRIFPDLVGEGAFLLTGPQCAEEPRLLVLWKVLPRDTVQQTQEWLQLSNGGPGTGSQFFTIQEQQLGGGEQLQPLGDVVDVYACLHHGSGPTHWPVPRTQHQMITWKVQLLDMLSLFYLHLAMVEMLIFSCFFFFLVSGFFCVLKYMTCWNYFILGQNIANITKTVCAFYPAWFMWGLQKLSRL